LEKQLNIPITLFSYPEGQEHHYDEKTIELLKAHGLHSSPSARFGLNTRETSPFHLYRNIVGFFAPFKQCLGE
jgi:hypothetical protein